MTQAFAHSWWIAACDAWWEAWLQIWGDVHDDKDGTYWADDNSRNDDLPDAADAHVDFGGGDE